MSKKSKLNKQFDKQFGEYVRKKRTSKQWTQPDLASRMGNNFQNVSSLERGEITPTLFWFYRLAESFEMKPEDMMKELGFKLKS